MKQFFLHPNKSEKSQIADLKMDVEEGDHVSSLFFFYRVGVQQQAW